MIIVGAGMAGLLAAQMLRRHAPVVMEAQAHLPDNHGAVLRFRTDAVSRATGIPFRMVTVQKAVVSDKGYLSRWASLQQANQYSFKVTKSFLPRSILNTEPVERFIAPADFLVQLARGVEVKLNSPMQGPVPGIWTVPMPALMKIVGWREVVTFRWRPIWSVTWDVMGDVDLYQTLYYPSPSWPFYRASMTGRKLTVEYLATPITQAEDYRAIAMHFGGLGEPGLAPRVTRQEYGKLTPCDEMARRRFILAMTQQHNLYTLGRFGTWRQLLLDDVVKDVTVIERLMRDPTGYAHSLQNVKTE